MRVPSTTQRPTSRHRDSLVKRIQGHAAAQHQLFHSPEERIKQLRHQIGQVGGKIDTYLGANPDSMTPEDVKRWAQGIMNVRATVGQAFADASNHPIVIPNYTNLKYNHEVLPDDLYAKLFLVKNPAPVGVSSYVELRDLQHPLFHSRDRISFTWSTPDGGGAGQVDQTAALPDTHPAGEMQGRSPIVLANNQLTATYASPGSGHVLFRGTATFEAGKHYWEVRLDALHNENRLGTHAIVGLVQEGTDSMASQTGLAWCVDKLSGVVPMALDCPAWTPGSLIGIFLDLDMDRVGLYYNKQCIAHVAIPHGRYTPAASIHCAHDQVTLLPHADIPAVCVWKPPVKHTHIHTGCVADVWPRPSRQRVQAHRPRHAGPGGCRPSCCSGISDSGARKPQVCFFSPFLPPPTPPPHTSPPQTA